jgi:thiamine pyrophosphokinase
MRAIIFVNGAINDYRQAARWLRADDYLIGADGGTRHCLELGRQPHAVVGDLDSLEPELVEQMVARDVLIERHRPDKDKTDLELALEFAIHRGATEVLMLGAVGDRLDQTLGNFLLLALSGWPIPIYVAEGNQLAQVLAGEGSMVLAAPPGSTVSVLALSDQVTGITYTGLVYPLDNFTLPIGSTRGMSNVVATAPATIRIASGRLLVVQALEHDVQSEFFAV